MKRLKDLLSKTFEYFNKNGKDIGYKLALILFTNSIFYFLVLTKNKVYSDEVKPFDENPKLVQLKNTFKEGEIYEILF